LLVFGDAICGTNPAYALGMSVAALQAAALQDTLAGGDLDLARRFFRAAAKPVNMAWQLTAGADLALSEVRGPRSLPVRIINAYATWVQTAAERDPAVAERLLRVAALQDPATRLSRPRTALRVLLGNLRRRRVPTLRTSAALAAGGRDNGAPGPRPIYHAQYYGAFVRLRPRRQQHRGRLPPTSQRGLTPTVEGLARE